MRENKQPALPINIIVAHGLEAKALVSMLCLERCHSSTRYQQYKNSRGLRLLVSGIGKEAVRAAVSYLGQQQHNDGGQIRAWVNIGIAGHRDAPLGSAWLGNKITEQCSGTSAYPPQLVSGFLTGQVVTVDEPETIYPIDAAYEMEASAFYSAAAKYSSAELVQVFKVISDNLSNPIAEMDLKSVPGLISAQASPIADLLEGIGRIVVQYNSQQRLPACFHEICSQSHLTVNQKLQLKRLCQRFKALGLEADLDRLSGPKSTDSGQLIRRLSQHLDQESGANASG